MGLKLVVSHLQMKITEGEVIPPYYGIAYWEWHVAEAVCYPIPLNLIVAACHRLLIWAKSGHKLWRIEHEQRIFEAGEKAGRKMTTQDLDRMFRIEEGMEEMRRKLQSAYTEGWQAALTQLENQLNKRGE